MERVGVKARKCVQKFFLSRSELYGRFFIGVFFQSQAASTMMSPFQERGALSFTFLEFEQIDIWSLSTGVRAALQAGRECLRGEHPRGVSSSAF